MRGDMGDTTRGNTCLMLVGGDAPDEDLAKGGRRPLALCLCRLRLAARA